MGQVPDAIVHCLLIVIKQCYFLRRIKLRKRTHARPHEKAQVFMFFAVDIGVHKCRMGWVINGCQEIGVHVVHGFSMQQVFGETLRPFAPFPYLVLPVIEDAGGIARSLDFLLDSTKKLLALSAGETENSFGKALVNFRIPRTPLEFGAIERSGCFEIEMAFPNEDRAGNDPVHRIQHRQRAFLKMECSSIEMYGEIVETESLAEANSP